MIVFFPVVCRVCVCVCIVPECFRCDVMCDAARFEFVCMCECYCVCVVLFICVVSVRY